MAEPVSEVVFGRSSTTRLNDMATTGLILSLSNLDRF